MAKLARCSSCGGFKKAARCPHCKNVSAVTLVVGGAIAFTLMACYGGPPQPTSGPGDVAAPPGDAGEGLAR